MASILIDFENIIEPNNLPELKKIIKPVPETKLSIGLVLVVSKEQYAYLSDIPMGYGRVEYLNSNMFTRSISGYAYLIYDKRKRVCEIMGIQGNILKLILESALGNIPNDVTLFIGVSLDSQLLESLIKEYVSLGFQDPYISNISPLGFEFTNNALCMLRKNDVVDSDIDVTNDIKYVFSQFFSEENNCEISIKLGDKAIKYLKKVSKMGSTINKNGIITQKEIGGKLFVNNIGDDMVYILEVDKKSIILGDEEGVKVVEGLYNFHSHPQEAYMRHNVKFGWPSAQDYLGFLGSSIVHGTILHIVSSIEGFYVLSMTEYWNNNMKYLDDDVRNFILDKYDLCSYKQRSLIWYVNFVNNIKYKQKSLFLVQFFTWDNAKSSFSVPYINSCDNCFARQSTKEKYKYLYNLK